jgi:hypothetical protein
MADTYRAGEFYRCCDRCGFKVRNTETKKEWNGLMVCLPCFDPRHPQDFVRGKVDKQNVTDPRPESADVFIDPENPVTPDDL